MRVPFLDDAVVDDRRIKPLEMVCESAATITWYRIPGTEWTASQASARIDEARRWYDRYCIHLQFEEFALDPAVATDQRIQRELDRLIPEYRARVARVQRATPAPERDLYDIQAALLAIHRQIVRKVGKDRLVVLFLDEWYVHVGATQNPTHWREWRISANDGQRLLVGLDRCDTDSPHILTHELLHALRKGSGANRTCFREFVRINAVTNPAPRPWQDHYGGLNKDSAMSFSPRARAFERFTRSSQHVLTAREYLTILYAGYVLGKPGCRCEERNKRRPPKRGKRA